MEAKTNAFLVLYTNSVFFLEMNKKCYIYSVLMLASIRASDVKTDCRLFVYAKHNMLQQSGCIFHHL